MSKDKKKSQIYLTENDIRKRCNRWLSVITHEDIEQLVKEAKSSPLSQQDFTDRIQELLVKRHLEVNPHLKPLRDNYMIVLERLEKNYNNYPERLEVMRTGAEKYGPTAVTFPLIKKDVAYIINYWEQNYQKVTTGKISMTIGLLIKLCAFFQVSADIILFGFHPFKTGEVNGKPLVQEKSDEENKLIQEKERIIEDLRDTIDLYREKVKKLEEEINSLKK